MTTLEYSNLRMLFLEAVKAVASPGEIDGRYAAMDRRTAPIALLFLALTLDEELTTHHLARNPAGDWRTHLGRLSTGARDGAGRKLSCRKLLSCWPCCPWADFVGGELWAGCGRVLFRWSGKGRQAGRGLLALLQEKKPSAALCAFSSDPSAREASLPLFVFRPGISPSLVLLNPETGSLSRWSCNVVPPRSPRCGISASPWPLSPEPVPVFFQACGVRAPSVPRLM